MPESTQDSGELTPKADISRYLDFGDITDPGRHKQVIKDQVALDPRRAAIQIHGLYTHPFLFEHPERFNIPIPQLPEGAPKREDYPDFPNVEKMVDMLFERGPHDLTSERDRLETLRISCAPASYFLASALKTHDIPARVRAGFTDWVPGTPTKYTDHWLTEYWNGDRWVSMDIDGMFNSRTWADTPKGTFITGGEAWNMVRNGQANETDFSHIVFGIGLRSIGIQMGFDFANLMGKEAVYGMKPGELETEESSATLLTKPTRVEAFDEAARLLTNPDKNIRALEEVWARDPLLQPQRF